MMTGDEIRLTESLPLTVEEMVRTDSCSVPWAYPAHPDEFPVRTRITMNGSEMRELRIRLNLTQEELADRLGVTQVRVSGWERDNPLVSEAVAEQLRSIEVDAQAIEGTIVSQDQ